MGFKEEIARIKAEIKKVKKEQLEGALLKAGRLQKSESETDKLDRQAKAEESAGKVLEGIEKGTQQLQSRMQRDKLIRQMQAMVKKTINEVKAEDTASEVATKLTDLIKPMIQACEEKEAQKLSDELIKDMEETAEKNTIDKVKAKQVALLVKNKMQAILKLVKVEFTGEHLSHAISAHGKGTDQISRLVTGKRSDQGSSLNPKIKLKGNKEVGDAEVEKTDKVESEPSNVSGAFNTNKDMLEAVNEGFAQAELLRKAEEELKKQGKLKTPVEDRIALNIKGKDGLGFNLTIEEYTKQVKEMILASDEIEKRYKAIKKIEVSNAKMVFDRLVDDKGNTIGWTLQTAFANNDELSLPHHSKEEAKKTLLFIEQINLAEKEVKEKEEHLKKLKEQVESTAIFAVESLINNMKKGLPKKKGQDKIDLQTKIDGEIKKLEEAKKLKSQLDTNYRNAKDAIIQAKHKLNDTRKNLEAYIQKQKEQLGITDKTPVFKLQPSAGYDVVTGLYNDKERPDKPDILKGSDEEFDDLTAHHLYPWNKIKKQINDALQDKNKPALEKLFRFGDVKVTYSKFWDELKLDPEYRSYEFADEINKAVPMICWQPRNIFMGPKGEKRSNDPGEDLDVAFTDSGLPTSPSALADLVNQTGGIIGFTKKELEEEAVKKYEKELEKKKAKLEKLEKIEVSKLTDFQSETITRIKMEDLSHKDDPKAEDMVKLITLQEKEIEKIETLKTNFEDTIKEIDIRLKTANEEETTTLTEFKALKTLDLDKVLKQLVVENQVKSEQTELKGLLEKPQPLTELSDQKRYEELIHKRKALKANAIKEIADYIESKRKLAEIIQKGLEEKGKTTREYKPEDWINQKELSSWGKATEIFQKFLDDEMYEFIVKGKLKPRLVEEKDLLQIASYKEKYDKNELIKKKSKKRNPKMLVEEILKDMLFEEDKKQEQIKRRKTLHWSEIMNEARNLSKMDDEDIDGKDAKGEEIKLLISNWRKNYPGEVKNNTDNNKKLDELLEKIRKMKFKHRIKRFDK